MKKILLLLSSVFILTSAQNVFAEPPTVENAGNFYTVGSSYDPDVNPNWTNAFLPKDTFGPAEKPWLNLYLPFGQGTMFKSMIHTEWYLNDSVTPTAVVDRMLMPLTLAEDIAMLSDPISRYFAWLSPDNWFDINPAGNNTWTIKGNLQQMVTSGTPTDPIWLQGINNNYQTQFYTNGPVVTPEPISSALFLLGGGALGLKKFRKKYRSTIQ